jgi:hypothetical protein
VLTEQLTITELFLKIRQRLDRVEDTISYLNELCDAIEKRESLRKEA